MGMNNIRMEKSKKKKKMQHLIPLVLHYSSKTSN